MCKHMQVMVGTRETYRFHSSVDTKLNPTAHSEARVSAAVVAVH